MQPIKKLRRRSVQRAYEAAGLARRVRLDAEEFDDALANFEQLARDFRGSAKHGAATAVRDWKRWPIIKMHLAQHEALELDYSSYMRRLEALKDRPLDDYARIKVQIKLDKTRRDYEAQHEVVMADLRSLYGDSTKTQALAKALAKLGIDSDDAPRLASNLYANGFKSMDRVLIAPPESLQRAGFSEGDIHAFNHAKLATLVSDPAVSRSTSSMALVSTRVMTAPAFLLFISYVKRDTLAETGLLFNWVKANHPTVETFRDTDQHFELSALVTRVKQSRNVVVFLSAHYGESPYCLVELCTAVQSGAHIVSIIVHKPGMELFNFENMNAMLTSGSITNLLDASGWAVLREQGFDPLHVVLALRKVMNVKAFDLHMNSPQRVINAELEVIWEGVLPDTAQAVAVV